MTSTDDDGVGARCDLHRRQRDLRREGVDTRLFVYEAGAFTAEPLGIGYAGVQDPDHGERRQGHACTSSALRRHEDREDGLGGGGGSESAEDRRQWLITARPRPGDLGALSAPMADRTHWVCATAGATDPGRADEPLVAQSARAPVSGTDEAAAAFAGDRRLLIAVAALGLRVTASGTHGSSRSGRSAAGKDLQDLQTQAQQLVGSWRSASSGDLNVRHVHGRSAAGARRVDLDPRRPRRSQLRSRSSGLRRTRRFDFVPPRGREPPRSGFGLH